MWLNYNWIYRIIHPYIDEANQNAGWNFEWNWTETSQFTEYKPDNFMVGTKTLILLLIMIKVHYNLEVK